MLLGASSWDDELHCCGKGVSDSAPKRVWRLQLDSSLSPQNLRKMARPEVNSSTLVGLFIVYSVCVSELDVDLSRFASRRKGSLQIWGR